jgi:hypothetical protein
MWHLFPLFQFTEMCRLKNKAPATATIELQTHSREDEKRN